MPTSALSPLPAGLRAGRASIPLEHVAVRAEIRDTSARVSCVQRYRNHEPQPVESVYVFPLDEAAAVCGFAAVVNGVRFEGEVRPREQAFASYDDAIADGHDAFLLDEERPDVFTASIGNLLPGAEVQIELTYVAELFHEGDAIRFMLPTTVAPRYAPPEDRVAIGRSPEEALNPPRQRDVPYGLSFSASIAASSRVRRIESPSHPIAVELEGDRAMVTLAQQNAALDRDVVLLISKEDVGGPSISLERDKSGHITAALTFRPSFRTEREPSDLIFVVDRSGSMQGTSIEQVRNALQLCLRSLDERCRFNIVGFGSAFESLFSECRQYDQDSLAEASRYVESLGATLGGTNMLPALDFALEHGIRSKRVLQLIVLTDGEVTNTDAVIDAVRRRAGQVRVFTFGIGRGASHHLVKGLARAGNGAAEFVYPGERIEGKVLRQFRRALSPALKDVTIEWNGTLATQIPETLGPVFGSDPLRIYALVHELREAPVTLRATGADGPLSWSLALDPTSVADGAMLGVLAARSRIRELEEGGAVLGRGSRQRDRTDDRVVSELVRLAMEYGLASRETSWVAIEKREVPTTADAVLRRVPIALTSGWGGEDTHLAARSLMSDTGAFDGSSLRSPAVPLEVRSALRSRGSQPSLSFNWLKRLGSKLERPRPAVTAALSKLGAPRALDALIALQGADGAWHLDQALASALALPLHELHRRLAGATGDSTEASRAWATALALTFLQRECASNRDEWELLAAKGQRWLAGVTARPPAGASWIDFAQTELAPSAWSLREASRENRV